MLFDATVPAVGFFRVEGGRAVGTVELIKGRRLEALPPAGAQDGAGIQIPGPGKLAGKMIAESLVLILASACRQGQAGNDLALELGIAVLTDG